MNNQFREGDWVKAKKSGGIRFITKITNSRYFEDDGKLSKQSPSPHCWFEDYEVIDIGEEIYSYRSKERTSVS
jgi:hypothetical protein